MTSPFDRVRPFLVSPNAEKSTNGVGGPQLESAGLMSSTAE
jgi:hypothetical protein